MAEKENQNWPLGERIELLFGGNRIALAVGMGTALALAVMHLSFIGGDKILVWLCFGVVITAARLALQISYQRNRNRFAEPVWLRLFLAGVFASGLFWGVAGALFLPVDAPEHVLFVAFALAGLCAGAVSVYSAVPSAFVLFAVPTLLPFMGRLIFTGEPTLQIMALMTGVFLFALSWAARGAYRTLSDIISLRLANEELARQATRDGLVDLLNHREFRRRLDRVLSEDPTLEKGCGLIFVDLDAFKNVNDTAGHLVGDELLLSISEVLKSPDAHPAAAARIGGDEFALLVHPVNLERAGQIGEWLREEIGNCQVVAAGREHSVGASVGVAFAQRGEFSAAEILKAADTACYEAKSSGRNRVRVSVLTSTLPETVERRRA